MSKQKKLKIVFAGTPIIAKNVLNSLIDNKHDIIASLTQPDRAAGRGKKTTASPVKSLSLENNINVLQPESFNKNPEYIEKIKKLQPDLMIVIAYGLILPQEILNIPKFGCWNIHVSLLPKYRGAAPIQHAILNGDTETGVTIMQMDAGLDTGDIIHCKNYSIQESETSETLHDNLSIISCEALDETLRLLIENDNIPRIKQPLNGISYANKITKAQAKIDWSSSAEQIERNIRGYNPWPVAHTMLDNQIVKIWSAEISENSSTSIGKILSISKKGIEISTFSNNILLKIVQFPGKKAMTVKELLNGKKLDHLIDTNL